jgi:hypothetical protein
MPKLRQCVGRWYIGHACEIAATPGVEVSKLRRESERFAPALEIFSARFLADGLAATGLDAHAAIAQESANHSVK